MRRRAFITLMAARLSGRSQRARSSPRCRWSGFSIPHRLTRCQRGFLQGLKDTGYVEGENVAIVYLRKQHYGCVASARRL
jgi:hypothetical protein